MNLNFILKSFDDLTNRELYNILTLRQSVFIVEQNCPYMDCDGKDFNALHLMGITEDERLAAYARIIEPGISYKEVSIGRVVTSIDFRRYGFGKKLMEEALNSVKLKYGNVDIRIGAQSYLLEFYETFGFETGESYMEDGIPHNIMLRRSSVNL